MELVANWNNFRSDWIRSVQIGSNWIKQDQDELGWLFGSNQIKLVQICPNCFKSVQIGSNQINLDQLGSNCFKWDQSELNEIDWNKLDKTGSNQIKQEQISSNWTKLDLIGSKETKVDQVGSNQMKLVQISSNWLLDIQLDKKEKLYQIRINWSAKIWGWGACPPTPALSFFFLNLIIGKLGLSL